MTTDPPLPLAPTITPLAVPPQLVVQIPLRQTERRAFSMNTLVVPLVTSLILLIPTVLYWAHSRSVLADFQKNRVAQYRLRLAKRIQTEVDSQLRPLRRLGDEITIGDVQSPQTFANSARSICREEPTLAYVAWVDRQGNCVSSYPPQASTSVASELFGPDRRDPIQLFARLLRSPAGMLLSFPTIGSNRAADRLIVLPILGGPGEVNTLTTSRAIQMPGPGITSVALSGAIVTRETTRAMIGALIPPDASAPVIVEVKDERGQILFSSDGAATAAAQDLLRSQDVDQIPVLDQSWSMSLVAAPPGLGQRPSTDTDAFLLTGLIVALLGGATVAQAARHRRREQQRTRAHLSALESLHAVAAAISGKPRTQSEIFAHLLDAACQLLRMPIALVVQLEGDRVRIARQVGFDPPLDWETSPLADLPMLSQCALSGDMLAIEDRDADPAAPQFTAMHRQNLASMLVFPLAAGEERIGIMALCDEHPRHFSDQDLRLARLWASQAAVTLANQRLAAANDEALQQQQRLNQQVRQDADAKAMLLRELNHRVKNNLAGIVGLLSAGCPDLSEPAQQWLDRAIARIETLARAHELFVGTAGELSLADLITKTLQPIWAIKPPGVQIRLDLSSANDPISTDQAITLAMVVHELASNALQHGLCDHGTLCVRAGPSRPGWQRIEVADDGTASHTSTTASPASGSSTATLPPQNASSGIGLQLVRGLVGRELHGVFSLTEIISGGTVATVEFPLSNKTIEA
jgi:two-component sensor histidine kinase